MGLFLLKWKGVQSFLFFDFLYKKVQVRMLELIFSGLGVGRSYFKKNAKKTLQTIRYHLYYIMWEVVP